MNKYSKKPLKSRTSHLSPADKFKYYFDLRMRLLKSALRGVGNLSNNNVYEIPDDAKRIIETEVRKWTKEFVTDKWNRSENKRKNKDKSESLYEQYFKK